MSYLGQYEDYTVEQLTEMARAERLRTGAPLTIDHPLVIAITCKRHPSLCEGGKIKVEPKPSIMEPIWGTIEELSKLPQKVVPTITPIILGALIIGGALLSMVYRPR